MNRYEVYLIDKNSGTMLYKYNILGEDESDKDILTSGFLVAIQNFAKEIDFPSGVSLIRSGNLEARFNAGDYVFTALIIDYSMPLGLMTEPILSGLANDITITFENEFKDVLEQSIKDKIVKTANFNPKKMRDLVDRIIDQYGKEGYELYQKLILIEAIYAKVPQKWIYPILEKISMGKNVFDTLLDDIPKIYHSNLKKAVEKMNYANKPFLEIFAIPAFEF